MPVDKATAIETASPEKAKQRALSKQVRKKILFVTNTSEYGGTERHLLALMRGFDPASVQVSVLCLGTDFLSKRLDPDLGISVISSQQIPRSFRDWVRLFRAHKTDTVVFIYGWLWCLPSIAPIAAWVTGISRRFAIQHLITEREPLHEPLLTEWKRRRTIGGMWRRLRGKELWWVPVSMAEQPLSKLASLSGPTSLKLSAYLCNTTICVSDAIRNSLVKDFGFYARKMRTVHNGVSLSEFVPAEADVLRIRTKLGLGPDEFVLFCAARLTEQKGIDILLQALARVAASGVSCKCIIVGDGPLHGQLLQQARELHLLDRVFFEGFQEDVRPYLHACSAFVLTSRWEGLPLSILEAMACGLPSIVTNVGGNAEAVTDNIEGLVIPSESVDAAAEAISYLATHPQERVQMSKMARARACDEFDIEKNMAKIRRLILS